MTEFEFDCLQKKIVSRSAFRRVGMRRGVALPSDHLNPAQLARRNGPLRIYRLGRPMTMAQFEAMPPDLQRDYLRRLQLRGASDEAVGRMLGISRRRLRQLKLRHRVEFDRPDTSAWQTFVQAETGRDGE